MLLPMQRQKLERLPPLKRAEVDRVEGGTRAAGRTRPPAHRGPQPRRGRRDVQERVRDAVVLPGEGAVRAGLPRALAGPDVPAREDRAEHRRGALHRLHVLQEQGLDAGDSEQTFRKSFITTPATYCI